MDSLDRKRLVLRFARLHADAWKQARKTNAQITNEIIEVGMAEGLTREEAIDIADDTLRYMRRYY